MWTAEYLWNSTLYYQAEGIDKKTKNNLISRKNFKVQATPWLLIYVDTHHSQWKVNLRKISTTISTIGNTVVLWIHGKTAIEYETNVNLVTFCWRVYVSVKWFHVIF